MKYSALAAVFWSIWFAPLAWPASLDDLKKLDIICFVPSYLPKGFQLKSVGITYDEIQEYEDKNHPLPLYSLVYGTVPSSPQDESIRLADRTGGGGAKFW